MPPCAVCDPVQGDNGQLYVSPDLPPAFRSELTPIATIMTPNQLEAELLTERSIGSVQEALDACAQLHRLGPHTVVSEIERISAGDKNREINFIVKGTYSEGLNLSPGTSEPLPPAATGVAPAPGWQPEPTLPPSTPLPLHPRPGDHQLGLGTRPRDRAREHNAASGRGRAFHLSYPGAAGAGLRHRHRRAGGG